MVVLLILGLIRAKKITSQNVSDSYQIPKKDEDAVEKQVLNIQVEFLTNLNF